jgi:tetratricopeptide (TPR) repeat protein
MPAIFISHSSRDQKASDDIKTALGKLGFERVFLDFDKDLGIGAGENWEKRLHDELSRCHAVILVLTPNWLASKWCFAELVQARSLGKIILPVICEPLGEQRVLAEIQSIDLLDWNDEGLGRLELRLHAITQDLARGFTLDPERPPFPGIHAFEAEDAAIYFGRDDETRTLIERLDARRTQGGARLVVVIGSSGCGKSSLLRAGVLPQLARRRAHWFALPPIRPEKAPLEAVAKAIAHQLGNPDGWEEWHHKLCGPTAADEIETLVKKLRVGEARAATVLVPIDQFEEVFTVATKDERVGFLRLLAALLDPARGVPIIVLATGRSDVLEGLTQADELARLYETCPLAAMPLDRVGRLVEGPAAVAGLNVQKGLSERIVRDLESPEALPMLAHTLWLLHRQGAADRRLSVADYLSLGDPKSGLNPIQNSVRLVADRALGGSSPSEAELAALRDAFVPHLVRVRLEDGKRVRQPTRLADLPAPSRRLVAALIEARLLSAREGVVEVAHEALFRAWPMLDQWLTEEHAFLADLERIRGSYDIWAQAPTDKKGGALLHGLLLSRARDWLLKYPQRFDGQDMEVLRAFVGESAAAEDAERARARRIRQFMFRGAVAAAVVFAAAAAIAGWQYFEAERARQQTSLQRDRAEAALAQADRNYTTALKGGSSVVDIVRDLVSAGAISTKSAEALLEISRDTVAKLENEKENDNILEVQWSLLHTLSYAYRLVPGRAESAVRIARDLRAHADKLLSRRPDHPTYREFASISDVRIGDALEDAGRLDEALSAYRAGAAGIAKLVAEDPANGDRVRVLIYVRQTIGDVLRKNGKLEEAHREYQENLAMAADLARRGPENPNWVRGWALAEERMGDILYDLRDLPGALGHYRNYRKASIALVGLESPSSPNLTWRFDLLISHQRIGDILLEQGEYAQALIEAEAYRSGAEGPAKANEERSEWQRFLSNAHIKVGEALLHLKRSEEALKEYAAAQKIYEQLVAKDQARPDWQRSLAIVQLRIGAAKQAAGDLAGARTALEKCLSIAVDDRAIDPQLAMPKKVHQECRSDLDQLGSRDGQ